MAVERVDRLDDVVGGDDRHHGVRVALEQDGGGEADGVGGVAAGRLAEEVVLRQLGRFSSTLLGVAAAVQTKIRSGGRSRGAARS